MYLNKKGMLCYVLISPCWKLHVQFKMSNIIRDIDKELGIQRRKNNGELPQIPEMFSLKKVRM